MSAQEEAGSRPGETFSVAPNCKWCGVPLKLVHPDRPGWDWHTPEDCVRATRALDALTPPPATPEPQGEPAPELYGVWCCGGNSVDDVIGWHSKYPRDLTKGQAVVRARALNDAPTSKARGWTYEARRCVPTEPAPAWAVEVVRAAIRAVDDYRSGDGVDLGFGVRDLEAAIAFVPPEVRKAARALATR